MPGDPDSGRADHRHRPPPGRDLPAPLDCLDRDGDGKYVLTYTDYKENRLHRRLPIPDSTAALIRGQQAAVRAAFPHTDPETLMLLPATSTNPEGTKPLRATSLTNLHRGWVDQLPKFTLSDDGIFPAPPARGTQRRTRRRSRHQPRTHAQLNTRH